MQFGIIARYDMRHEVVAEETEVDTIVTKLALGAAKDGAVEFCVASRSETGTDRWNIDHSFKIVVSPFKACSGSVGLLIVFNIR